MGLRPQVWALLSFSLPHPLFPSVLSTLRGPLWSQFQVLLLPHLPRMIPRTDRTLPCLPMPMAPTSHPTLPAPVLQLLVALTSLPSPASSGSPLPVFTHSPSGRPWALARLPTHGWRTRGPTRLEAPQPRNPGEAAAPATPTQTTDTTMVRSSDSLRGTPASFSPLNLWGQTEGSRGVLAFLGLVSPWGGCEFQEPLSCLTFTLIWEVRSQVGEVDLEGPPFSLHSPVVLYFLSLPRPPPLASLFLLLRSRYFPLPGSDGPGHCRPCGGSSLQHH